METHLTGRKKPITAEEMERTNQGNYAASSYSLSCLNLFTAIHSIDILHLMT